MPLTIIRNDITAMNCDAIVNAANRSLLGGGGVDGAIHRAAGHQLLDECRTLGGCETGKAKATLGYLLPCKYVFHTVGPIWHGGNAGERELLVSCYRECLSLALQKNCDSIAFPLISGGAYGYPKKEALQTAVSVITEFLIDHEMDVYMVLFDREGSFIGTELYGDIKAYIDNKYTRENERFAYERRRLSVENEAVLQPICCSVAPCSEDELKKRLSEPDESFSEMLLRLIDERGMNDVECYKKANVDRKHFSKIRSDSHYRPSKQTALAFAIALELTHNEAVLLLRSAGFAFSHSSKFDIIVEYFIERGIYDIYAINQALFSFDQCTLGV